MLRSIKQLYGNKLGASDGEIGEIKDFYFGDQDWTIRYLVVDTGIWLPGRQVLLTPQSLGRLDQLENILRVNLTRKQIEESPSIESHEPVSRQYEETYHRYYRWLVYWDAAGKAEAPGLVEPAKPHLRSVRAVTGYQLRSADGFLGHVCDFMIDAQSWAIRQLSIKTGHRLSGTEVLIEIKNVNGISYETSTVFGDLTTKPVAHAVAPQTI